MSSTTTYYVEIIEKFLDPRSSHSIQKSGKNLKFCFAIVTLLYVVALTAMYFLNKKFHRHLQVQNVLVIEFMPTPVPKPVVIEKSKLEKQPDLSEAISSSNTVIANPSNIREPTSAPIKQGAEKDKPSTPSGQMLNNTKMSISGGQAKSSVDSKIAIKTNDGLATKKDTSGENNQTVPSKLNAPFNDIKNEGPGQGTLVGPDGSGGDRTKNGNGGGGNDLAGNGGRQIAMTTPRAIPPGMGNIAPYRKDMLTRIAQKWTPRKHYSNVANVGNIVVVITIKADGQLLDSEIISSSGDEKLDKYAIEIMEQTPFAPLPEWFKGNQLKFKIELARVEAIRGDI